jgi:glutamine amidotransferase
VISIVNYGLGNVLAIANIYKRIGVPARIVTTPEELSNADRIILPGVGAFDWAMTRLNESGMRARLDDLVARERRPVLGICVGMQMMAARSDEGVLDGLHWIDGEVRRFDEASFTAKTRLPHMGWNDVVPRVSDGLFEGLAFQARFYFLHSYYFVPDRSDDVLAETDYNGRFAASVCHGNVWGVQFHPEKSHSWGIRLLQNFASL